MILLDLSPTLISSFLATHTDKSDINDDYIRHLVLNCIRSYLVKFRHEYGELIICCDSSNNWRKDVYPYYKAGRKKARDDSGYNWPRIFEAINKIRDEIRDNFPYKTLLIDRAEADDIIAVLTKKYANSSEKILIISPDRDYRQLQKYDNVKQYDTIRKQWIECVDPLLYLKEHIIYGDKGDGVPNFLSEDDTFVSNKRQKSIRQTKVDLWTTLDPKDFCTEYMLRNYMRNRAVIDFDYIPENISELILEQYENTATLKNVDLYGYFVKNKLTNLISELGSF